MPNLTSILGLSGAYSLNLSYQAEQGGAESNLAGGASTKIELRSQAWLILSFVLSDPKGFEMRFCAEERRRDREGRRKDELKSFH